MKKLISLSLVLMLLLGVLAVPALAEDAGPVNVGCLSYLAMTEEENHSFHVYEEANLRTLLALHDVLLIGPEGLNPAPPRTSIYYDSLNALLLGLQSGEVVNIMLPYYTAKYLSASDENIKLSVEYHPENVTCLAEWALARISDGYSFLLKNDHTELRDEIDAQLTAMKEDGTLRKLIDEHIVKVAEGGEPVAVEFEQFEGDPIRVGVSGDLPPMDYKAADDSFAGFNTAVLAELGKRLQKNIELVQVDNVARALALSEGKVDVVFWTRALSEDLVEQRAAGESLDDYIAKYQDMLTDEEKAFLETMERPDDETIRKIENRDLPEETIITQPYFSDIPILVGLK